MNDDVYAPAEAELAALRLRIAELEAELSARTRAADELFTDDTISDATWKALDEQFDERQLLDVLVTTGGYRMVSMVLNTFGVPAEPNSEPFP